MSASHPSAAQRPWTWSRILLWARRASAVASLLLLLALGWFWTLWQTRPASYHEHQRFLAETTPQRRTELAQGLESQLTAALSHTGRHGIDEPIGPKPHAGPDDGTRSLRLPLIEARAWLDQRLRPWAAQHLRIELPPNLRQASVTIEEGQVLLSANVGEAGAEQWLSAQARLTLQPQGSARLHFSNPRAGRLPLPTQRVLDEVQQRRLAPPETVQWLRKAFGDGLSFDPVWNLPGGRRARLLAFAVEPNAVTLTLRILDPEAPSP